MTAQEVLQKYREMSREEEDRYQHVRTSMQWEINQYRVRINMLEHLVFAARAQMEQHRNFVQTELANELINCDRYTDTEERKRVQEEARGAFSAELEENAEQTKEKIRKLNEEIARVKALLSKAREELKKESMAHVRRCAEIKAMRRHDGIVDLPSVMDALRIVRQYMSQDGKCGLRVRMGDKIIEVEIGELSREADQKED